MAHSIEEFNANWCAQYKATILEQLRLQHDLKKKMFTNEVLEHLLPHFPELNFTNANFLRILADFLEDPVEQYNTLLAVLTEELQQTIQEIYLKFKPIIVDKQILVDVDVSEYENMCAM
jgi:hypothetical protein